MGRREKPVGASGSRLSAFAEDLRSLRAAAGNPSYRRMAGIVMYSPSVLSEAAGGYRLPTLPVTLAFVKACDGDIGAWERRWRAERARASPPLTGESPGPAEPGSGEEASPSAPGSASAAGGGPTWTPGSAGSAWTLRSAGSAWTPGSAGLAGAGIGWPRPAQLPVAPLDFVGREAEFEVVTAPYEGVGSHAPLVIRGPVGVGKTAFALRYAHRAAPEFPDGQLWADMCGTTEDALAATDVLGGFLLALGVPAAAVPGDATHRIGLYRSILAQRRVLVLLDNVRDEAQVRPLLAHTPASRVLVVSRSRLLGLEGVRRVIMAPLPRTEAVDLLRVLIGGERVRAEPAAALRIAEFCGYLPLAVTVAGRKIAAQPGRGLREVAERLDAGVNVANWLRIGDIGLANALLPAYLSLPPLGKHVVHMLGRGCDEVTPIGLARHLHISVDAAEHVMDTLVDSGLLHRVSTPERYIMPRLIGSLLMQETGRLAERRIQQAIF
ncbi:hypothetical protein JK358_04530 [Nocardia sp. 2]|uniref:NB-ARC domain-containing protein n=1 Tax=Nocardia acididurans TaxID=2802282 RepID=A0ABS1LZ05_9NOCA|nr:ATP-binding protein [Nocardia acididurans]MBL1073652.1 hypothetical protein [Nocardia acididurans]